MHTQSHKAMLRAAAKINRDYAAGNPALDRAIAKIRGANPDAFWMPEMLPLRRFFHRPKDLADGPVPHQSFVIDTRKP